jgi:hypothetical protein
MLLAAPAGFDEALRSAGIEVVVEEPELVIAAHDQATRAAATGAPAVIVLGHAARTLRRAGYESRSILVRYRSGAPRLFVPLDAPAALGSALLARRPGRPALKRFAIRTALAARRAGLPGAPIVTVAHRGPGRPDLLEAAGRTAGLELGPDWFLWLGEGDDLQRAVWVCFGADAEPSWAVKCSRVPGNVGPFAREEQAAAVLAGLPAGLRRHAPRHAGRFELDGLPGSLESAAHGLPLQEQLEAGEPSRSTVEAVAAWIVAVGQATMHSGEALEPERRRLEDEVLSAWAGHEVPAALVRSVPSVPAVLQHNDLGSWNVMVDGPMFTVLDWESSRVAGLPLWDLVYFLTDTLAARRGQTDPVEKLDSMLSLLRGESPASAFLFERVAAAAATFGVPRDEVGAVVTLGWLNHGLSRAARAQRGRAQNAATGGVSSAGPLERIAEPWLADSALGISWPAFASL